MGQAKKRGNFNDRKASAIQRDIQNARLLEEVKQRDRLKKLEEEQDFFDSLTQEQQLEYLETKQEEKEKRAKNRMLLTAALATALTNNR